MATHDAGQGPGTNNAALATSQDVPAADSVANLLMRDVIGSKSDTIDGTSLMAYTKLIKSRHLISGTSPNTAGTANTSTRIELDSNASSVDGAYDPASVMICSGTGAGQARQIWEYDGTNKYAYVNRDWKVTPDDTSEYCIVADAGNTHVNEGVAQAGSNNTITLNALASAQDSLYLGQTIFIVAGTGTDQARMVVGYNGTTKVATVDANWIVNPDSTSVYAMLPYPGFVHGIPAADVAANVLSRDVIGNKTDAAADTANVVSIVGLVRQAIAEAKEIDGHIHNVERWFGPAASPSGSTHIADPIGEVGGTPAGVITSFRVTTGANKTWGTAVQVWGSTDYTLMPATKQAFLDMHRFRITGAETDRKNWYLRIIVDDTSAAAGVTADTYGTIPIFEENTDKSIAPVEMITTRIAQTDATMVWVQALNPDDNDADYIDMQFGVHGYPA